MDIKPIYPAGANTTGLICAALLVAFGFGLMQPVLGLLLNLLGMATRMAAQAG